MKKYIILLIVLITTTVVIFGSIYAYDKITADKEVPTESSQSQNKPGTANDFTAYNYDKEKFTLTQMQGKPTVVNFWATWCPPCVGELPQFENAYKEYGTRINFMMVNTEDASQMRDVVNFINDNGYSFPVYYDLDYSGMKTYSINAIPVTLFIDANGNLIDKQVGAMDEATLKEKIEQLL